MNAAIKGNGVIDRIVDAAVADGTIKADRRAEFVRLGRSRGRTALESTLASMRVTEGTAIAYLKMRGERVTPEAIVAARAKVTATIRAKYAQKDGAR